MSAAIMRCVPPLDKAPTNPLLARRLNRETGGNPFYLVEGIRDTTRPHRCERGLLVSSDPPIPDTLWKAVMERLSYLTPAARRIWA